jgi:uncharacterized protein
MNTKQIIQVIKNENLPDTFNNVDYVETPNSWIIRSDNHAFKIRKPVQANGKDLTTTEQRKNICLKELELNKPLAGKTYESVVSLKKVGAGNLMPWHTNTEEHALKMKRLREEKNLFELLKNKKISREQLENIAAAIASFHQKADIVKNTINITGFQDEFEEITRCDEFVRELFGEKYLETIYNSIETSKEFLSDYRYFIQERTLKGFIRDGHGNLSASRIFLNDDLVITDRVILCDEQRKVDVLFDIALLGIDFDYFEFQELDNEFLTQYITTFGDKLSNKTRKLYTYYKLYRAGQLITEKLDRSTIFTLSVNQKQEIIRYFELLNHYMEALKTQ